MTGFGQSQAVLDGVGLSIEVSSVNRKNLEVSVSIPREWQSLEREIQNVVKQRFNRGKLHFQIQATAAADEGGFYWDESALDSTFKRMEKAAERQGINWDPCMDTLIRLAAMNKADTVLPTAEAIADNLLEHVTKALDQLASMREVEGSALANDLETRVGTLAARLKEIQAQAGSTMPRYREILLQRLRQADLEIDLSDERVLKEIAIFADKCDVSEEVTRLESHIDQLKDCLLAGSPVGRKLEFILQEVNREFNTIGSKAGNIAISREVIEAKNEIERIREQIQNIE
jgi:uncharacterized protein (TIGR00255 family)